ncbi:MAG: tetratricopeptide repeat protein [Lewinellaceae bacterium]|nr:tetratricopeptide repeat protein [Lewinellaceae bacterium]
MAKKRLTVRDKVQKQQQATFVGREMQLSSFQENLRREADALHFANIVNVFGQGGVGKTTLLRKFEEQALKHKALVAYTDEGVDDVPEYMAAVAEQLERQGAPLKKFQARYRLYRQKKQELEADPQAPVGFAAFMGRTIVKSGVGLAKGFGGGAILEHFDTEGLANQAGEWASFVAKKLTNKEEVRLVLEPVKVLTPIWLEELSEIAEDNRVCLLIDTYEETAKFLDSWLRELLDNRYGDFDANIILTISGRLKLDANHWSVYNDLCIALPVEPFTEEEAASYLDRKGIIDPALRETISRLSGKVPVLMATLAEASPNSADGLEDVSNLAVERFLKWVPDSNKRDTALYAALPLHLNLDVLGQLAPPEKTPELFDWLQSMPFVQKRAQEWTYHPIVRAQMLHYLRIRSRDQWAALHGKLAAYFEQKQNALGLEGKKALKNEDWVEWSLQVFYHRFCENPHQNLSYALNGFLSALEEKRSYAKRWAETLSYAERDFELPAVRCWGASLTNGLAGYDKDDYLSLVSALERIMRSTLVEDNNKPIALAWRAEAYRLSGKYNEALADFNQAIESRPDYEWALVLRGLVYQDLKRYEEALADLGKAIELKPDYEWALVKRGSVFQDLKRYEEALADLSRAIALKPEYKWALVKRGSVFQGLKRYEEALADLSRAIALNPEYKWALVERGSVYQDMKRYEEALADLGKAFEMDPAYDWALAQRGSVYQDMKRYEEALVDLNKAIELDPEADWFYQRGSVYQDLKRYEEALADLSKAIELNPDDEWALALRGSVYKSLKRPEEALNDLGRAINLSPEYVWAITQRGSVYRAIALHEDALTDLNKAIGLEPDYETAFAFRGVVYMDKGHFDEALADLNKAIELEPKYEWAVAQRGRLNWVMERYEEALTDLSKAIELKPDYEWALVERSSVYKSLKRYEEALADLGKVIELKPDDEWNYAQRGKIYLKIGRIPDAKTNFQQAMQIDPGKDWNYYLSFLASRKEGNHEDANKQIQEAITLANAAQKKEPRNLINQFNLSLYYLVSGQKEQFMELIVKTLDEGATAHLFEDFIDDLRFYLEILPGSAEVEEMLLWAEGQLARMKKGQSQA